ncbi:MAG: hypothetical protein EOO46_12565 [Flavobacterium sp.]|nr:MAG: hypothetical protein EOO46_12565 [Flavobacterium sp.]
MKGFFILSHDHSFEVAPSDLEEMTFEEARELSRNERWRLPYKEEHELMYRLHQKTIGNFQFASYWSAEGYNNKNAFTFSYSNGMSFQLTTTQSKPAPKKPVRLVRTI